MWVSGREVENYILCHLCQQPVNAWFTLRTLWCSALQEESVPNAFNILLDHWDSKFSWPQNFSNMCHLLDWSAPFIVGGGYQTVIPILKKLRVTDSRLSPQCFGCSLLRMIFEVMKETSGKKKENKVEWRGKYGQSIINIWEIQWTPLFCKLMKKVGKTVSEVKKRGGLFFEWRGGTFHKACFCGTHKLCTGPSSKHPHDVQQISSLIKRNCQDSEHETWWQSCFHRSTSLLQGYVKCMRAVKLTQGHWSKASMWSLRTGCLRLT